MISSNNAIEILFESKAKEERREQDIIIEADKGKNISGYFKPLSNAIKFTEMAGDSVSQLLQ